jgi:hypothetical protein
VARGFPPIVTDTEDREGDGERGEKNQNRPLTVQFSDLDLSSDAGLLLAFQAEEQVQIFLKPHTADIEVEV